VFHLLNRLRNHMRQEAQRATADISMPRAGIVTGSSIRSSSRAGSDPAGRDSDGYLPIHYPWVGNGWGMAARRCRGKFSTYIFSKAVRKRPIFLCAPTARDGAHRRRLVSFWLVISRGPR